MEVVSHRFQSFTSDTDPRAMEVWVERLRGMTPGERMAAALELSALALRMSEAGVRVAHPKADDREVRLRAAARHMPRELLARANRSDPEKTDTPTHGESV